VGLQLGLDGHHAVKDCWQSFAFAVRCGCLLLVMVMLLVLVYLLVLVTLVESCFGIVGRP